VIFSNPFFGAFAEGVAVVAEESGYGLTFISPLDGSLARAVGRATVDWTRTRDRSMRPSTSTTWAVLVQQPST
jgi:hypothetical protein